MFAVLASAKNDPAAELIAQALGNRVVARIVIGERTPTLALGHIAVLVVWSAFAAAHAGTELAALCAGAKRAILLRTDEADWLELGGAHATVDWRAGGLPAALALLEAGRAPQSEAQKPSVAQWAAGALAMASALTPSAATAAPAAMPRGVHETRQAGRTQRREIAQTQAAGVQAIERAASAPAAELDLDALPTAGAYDPAAAAAELLQHAPRTHVDFAEPAPRKVTILELGPLSIRV